MIKKIAIILNVILASFLVLIHFSASINPLDFWPFAFLGLIYPIIFILNLIFLFIWLFTSAKKLTLLSLIALIITWSSNKTVFQLSTNAETLNEISILSWNVKNFDYYNWSGNENARGEMLALLEENRPNILCLQEFYTEDKGEHTNFKDIRKGLDYKYQYFAKTYSKDGNRHWGMVIFSDYKIIDSGKLTFTEGTRLNTCMYVDLALTDAQVARVYNVHFQSNQFSKEDYDYLENFNDNQDGNSALNILRKLKHGYMNRAEQVQQVIESKAESPYPSIICGDFNDTPVSFAYKSLSKGMNDAFIEKGLGFGKTYVNRTPFLRIDFALFHTMFTINDYSCLVKDAYSDHYPIGVTFTF